MLSISYECSCGFHSVKPVVFSFFFLYCVFEYKRFYNLHDIGFTEAICVVLS